DRQESLTEDLSRLKSAIAYVDETIENANRAIKSKKDKFKDKPSLTRPLIEVTYEQFVSIEKDKDNILGYVSEIEKLREIIDDNIANIARLSSDLDKLRLYSNLRNLPQSYVDTCHAFIALGSISRDSLNAFTTIANECDGCCIEVVGNNTDSALLVIVVDKEQEEFISSLSSFGFTRSNLSTSHKVSEEIQLLEEQIAKLKEETSETEKKVTAFLPFLKQIRIYSDYVFLQNKKCVADGNLPVTDYTFVMEGWCPSEKQQEVTELLSQISDGILLYFNDIADDEFAPTLNRNNAYDQPFESVTNGYTPQNYHEPDPTPAMSIFYFLIFGLMVADVGYGLVLAVLGILASALIKQKTGIKTMLIMFGYCGYSAIIWGLLFGSFFTADIGTLFGISYLPPIPNPTDFPIVTIMISLAIGILHLMTGFLCNAIKLFKRKDIVGGIFDALIWVVFMAGLVLFALKPAFGMIIDMCGKDIPIQLVGVTIPDLSNIGMYVVLGSLIVVFLTHGRGKKGIIGKIVGGFGGLYGIINYFADIISYVRIFGIMLSGAVFGSIINQLAGGLGILAPILLFGAHAFNLVLALLSCYVHNARLQYVEFYGKFFEGEGQLFTPFGSDLTYTLSK
ncbi:MAG: V-type ATPase 116kDa subunit family protein, partial [Clostridia bacterium]